MRLITLNIWCGKLSGELIDFVKSKSTTTDVFCFQEVLDNRRGIPSAVFKDGSEDIANRLRQADRQSHLKIIYLTQYCIFKLLAIMAHYTDYLRQLWRLA